MPIVVCDKCGAKNRVETQKAEKLQPTCGRCGNSLAAAEVSPENSKPLHVTDETFQRDVIGARKDLPVLLDCWAPWCGPCRTIAPALDQLAAEAAGKYLIAKLNVDENPRTASQFRIQSIPTMLIFKNGQVFDQLIGAQPKQTIAAKLAQAVKA